MRQAVEGSFSVLSYTRMILDTKSFKVQPIATLWRAADWMLFHVLPRREATIRVPLGSTSFRLRLPPVLEHFSSTGIFVQRQFYEPLLEFADRLVGKGTWCSTAAPAGVSIHVRLGHWLIRGAMCIHSSRRAKLPTRYAATPV